MPIFRGSSSFIEKSLASLAFAARYSEGAEALADRRGALQRVDPRVKLAGLGAMIVAVAASRRLASIMALFAVAAMLAVASRIPPGRLAAWVWMPVLLFTGAIAAPALMLTPGQPLHWAGRALPITESGLRGAAFLLSRAETVASLSALLILSTPWPHLLKALRALRVPVVAVVVLGMTYRYVFSILQTASDMLESRKSRTVGAFAPAERRRIITSSMGVLLSKSLQMSNDVHQAMVSRGFRGETYLLSDFVLKPSDWCWLGAFAAAVSAAFWIG